MNSNELDVLIIGAGPVGLFCSNECSRHGLSNRIIDKKTQLSTHSKALGLHIRTLDILDDCGLYDRFAAEATPITGVMVYQKNALLWEIDFADLDSSRSFLLDLPQDRTEHILSEQLTNEGVEWNTELINLTFHQDRWQAEIRLDDTAIEYISAKWIIACDGAHSTARHLLNIPFEGSAYLQRWWLADLLIEWDFPSDKMVMWPNAEGPLACFPMGGKRYRLVVSAPCPDAQVLTLEMVQQIFRERSGNTTARLSDPVWLTPFSIHHRQIPHYHYHSLFFCGDSAHIHSPIGGQGLNTGIQDGYNLIWKLALVTKNNGKLSLLSTYNEERYPIGRQVLKKTDRMTKLLLLSQPFLVNLRNRIIAFILSFKSLRRAIISDVAELSISYKKSSLSRVIGRKTGFEVGTYLPTIELTNQQQQTVSLQSLTQGTLHHLFLFLQSTALNNEFEQALELFLINKPWLKLHLVLLDDAPINVNRPILRNITLNITYRLHASTALLIRPDKYCSVVQSPINLTEIDDYFKTFIQ